MKEDLIVLEYTVLRREFDAALEVLQRRSRAEWRQAFGHLARMNAREWDRVTEHLQGRGPEMFIVHRLLQIAKVLNSEAPA